MSDAKWGNREVKSIATQQGKFGAYKVLTTIDGKGKQREERLYDRTLQTLVTKPGAYSFGYELGESGYPEIVGIKPLTTAPDAQNGATEHRSDESVNKLAVKIEGASSPFKRDSDTNRAILLQVCIKAAAEVYQGMGREVDDKDDGAPATSVINMAQKFLEWAELNAK